MFAMFRLLWPRSHSCPDFLGLTPSLSRDLWPFRSTAPVRSGHRPANMSLTIVEGKRTVLQYLLSPVQRVTDEAGRER